MVAVLASARLPACTAEATTIVGKGNTAVVKRMATLVACSPRST
jgi:hypothetical protein